MVLMGFVFVAMVALFAILNYRLSEFKDENDEKVLEEIRDIVVMEVRLAAVFDDGYAKEFSLPMIYRSINYSIEYDNWTLSVYDAENRHKASFILNNITANVYVKGNVSKGLNLINRSGGNITITPI